jgi:hypothetical protein
MKVKKRVDRKNRVKLLMSQQTLVSPEKYLELEHESSFKSELRE